MVFSICGCRAKICKVLTLEEKSKDEFRASIILNKRHVDVIAYCVMPTHIHIILRQLSDCGIERFVGNILNSYTKYFNLRHKRKGPLWNARFKAILVSNDDYLLHLTRYIHLNPVSVGIVDSPLDWRGSSYKEYLGVINCKDSICNYSSCLDIEAKNYEKFVVDRIDYQRALSLIKHLLLE